MLTKLTQQGRHQLSSDSLEGKYDVIKVRSHDFGKMS